MISIALAIPIAAATSLLAARRGVERELTRNGHLFALAAGLAAGLAAAWARADAPLIGTAGLAGGLGLLAGSAVADARERYIDVAAVSAGGALCALALVIAVGSPAPTLLGAAFTGGLAILLFAGGALWARLRGARDPQTGRLAEDFGSGDIPVWALAGALLGSLSDPFDRIIAAILGAHLLAGAVAGGIIVYKLVRRRGDDIYLPFVPAIALVVIALAALGSVG